MFGLKRLGFGTNTEQQAIHFSSSSSSLRSTIVILSSESITIFSKLIWFSSFLRTILFAKFNSILSGNIITVSSPIVWYVISWLYSLITSLSKYSNSKYPLITLSVPSSNLMVILFPAIRYLFVSIFHNGYVKLNCLFKFWIVYLSPFFVSVLLAPIL